jgi:Family of unknown function (DUF5681)
MPANAAEKQRSRGRGRPFQKGQSGNPQGKAPGTRHHVTELAEKLMSDDVEEIVRKIIKAAKAGDMTAARLILERIAPVRRGRLVQLELPTIKTATDLISGMEALATAMAAGIVTPEEALTMASVVDAQRRTIETKELDARLRALEAKVETNEQGD